MAIKIKAIERNVSFEKNKEKWAFVLQPELYSRLSEQKVLQEAALRSGINRGTLSASWQAIGDVTRAWATEGQRSRPRTGNHALRRARRFVRASGRRVERPHHQPTRNLHPKHRNQGRAGKDLHQHHLL